MAHADDDDPVQGGVSLPGCRRGSLGSGTTFARCWNWTHAAELGERGFRTDALRIVADKNQHFDYVPGSDPGAFSMAGACAVVRASRSASCALISALRVSQRRAIARRAVLTDATVEITGPDRERK